MVKVFTDIDDPEINKARGITKTSNEGDPYYIRRKIDEAPSDPRTREDWRNQVDKPFAGAVAIWKSGKPCFQDHFYRGKKTFQYGHSMNDQWEKTLSGYQLAINMFIKTLNLGNGSYYKPKCFCIAPVDMIGKKVHTHAHLILEQNQPLQYKYDETNLLETWKNYVLIRRDPFISAAELAYGQEKKLRLTAPFALTREEKGKWWDLDPSVIKDYPVWVPISLTQSDIAFPRTYNMFDCCSWEVKDKGIYDWLSPDEPVKAFEATFFPDLPTASLCNQDTVKLFIEYAVDYFKCTITYSDAPPFYDLYYASDFILKVGVGAGNIKTLKFALNYQSDDVLFKNTIGWHEHTKPCPKGKTPCNHIIKKITNWKLDKTVYGSKCTDPDGYNGISYYFSSPEPVTFIGGSLEPEIQISAGDILFDDRGFQNWYNYGAVRISTSEDGETYTPYGTGNPYVFFEKGKYKYCFNNTVANKEVNFILLRLKNGTVWNDCTRSTIDGLRTLERLKPGEEV